MKYCLAKSRGVEQVFIRIAFVRHLQNFQDIFLQIRQLGDKAIGIPVRQAHFPADDIFKLLKQVFGLGRAVVLLIWHEVVQPPLPAGNIGSGVTFNQADNLQGDFEQKEIRLNSLGRMNINRLQTITALGPPVGVLDLVLVLVRFHRGLDREVTGGLVGHQRVIAASVKRCFIGFGLKRQTDTEMIIHYFLFFNLSVFGLPASALVFVGDHRLVFDLISEEISCLVFLQYLPVSGINGLSGFKPVFVELA